LEVELADILTILLFFESSILVILLFHSAGAQPAAIYFLALYVPVQNILLPAIWMSTGISDAVALFMLSFKDLLLMLGLLMCAGSVRRLKLRFPDFVGLLFLFFLLGSVALSPSDAGSALRGLRSFAAPVGLYFYGRLARASGFELDRFARVIVVAGLFTAVYGLVEFCLNGAGFDLIPSALAEYSRNFYGHGGPTVSSHSQGFLGYPQWLHGPFGNNLLTASFLRVALCTWIYGLARSGRRVGPSGAAIALLLGGVSVLTLSRYAIACTLLIGSLLLFQRSLWHPLSRALACFVLITTIGSTSGIWTTVVTTTLEIGDQSTHAHVESLEDLWSMELTLLGHGLGTGAHSVTARTTERTSEGEGLIRQAFPEIGLLGLALFGVLALAAIVLPLRDAGLRLSKVTALPPTFWIALPLLLELVRTPVDIGIRSFLGSGLAWFMVGSLIRSESDAPAPKSKYQVHGRVSFEPAGSEVTP
jgi:hypothetical protein